MGSHFFLALTGVASSKYALYAVVLLQPEVNTALSCDASLLCEDPSVFVPLADQEVCRLSLALLRVSGLLLSNQPTHSVWYVMRSDRDLSL